MAELDKTGQPESQPVAAPPTGEPQTQAGGTAPQAEGQPPPTPGIPEKFKGKSAEEIAAAYLEVEKGLTKKAQEAAELREIAERLYYQSMGQPQQQAQVQPPPETTKPEFDWEKPVETVEQILERKLSEREAAQAYYQRQGLIQRAAVAHDEGKAVMSKNPKLFGGIEREVEQMVYQSLAPSVAQGYDVSGALMNPKTWEGAAALYWLNKGQYDRLNFAPQPMSATAGELPSQTRQSQSDAGLELPPLTNETKEMLEGLGFGNLTPKEMRELLAKGDEGYVGTRRR